MSEKDNKLDSIQNYPSHNKNQIKVKVKTRKMYRAVIRRIPSFMREQDFHEGLTKNVENLK